MRTTGNKLCLALLAVAGMMAASGCSTTGARSAYRNAEQAAERELWDQAVLGYAKANALEPGNTRYKVALSRAKLRAATEHFDRGKRYLASGQIELAVEELQEAVILDPSNQYAAIELQKANDTMARKLKGPSDIDRAAAEARRRAAELGPPKLNPKSRIPIVLRLPSTDVESVMESIGKASGINVIFDEKVDKKKKLQVELVNVTFEEAMDVIMLQTKLFYKVLDSSTIVIADDNRQKRTEYEDHVIRTFYLSNAETKDVQTLLRGLLESRRIAENADLNAITIKDTPEKIKVAERIIKANDKAKGEVVVDLELLEISRVDSQKLGFDLSSKTLSLVFGDGKQAVPLNNLSRLKAQSAWSLGVIPSLTFDFLKSDTDSKTISKPSVRILEGENGKITIGDRVPIPATTFNSSQTVGGNIVPVTSFTYQNVGIIVDIKPRVHHNKEITLELKLEVSSLAGSVQGTGGVSQPIIGTRSVETTIRLRDGETNILAGLIREEDRQALSGVPGLSDLPLLRRLFGSTTTDRTDTDIVLALTPHIIRTPNIEPIDLVPLWVGTEEQIELRGVARNALGESPFADGDTPWDEIDGELNGDDAKTPQIRIKPEPANSTGAEANPANRTNSGDAAQQPPARQPRRRRGADAATETAPPPPPPAEPTGDDASADDAQDSGDAAGDDEQGAESAQAKGPVMPAAVQLIPDRPQAKVGEGVGVDLMVRSAENVGQVNLQIRFNPEVLRFVPPGEPGEFMAQGGVIPDVQVVEGGDGGMVVLSLSRAGAAGASGGGRLLRLNFVALAPGTSSLQFAGGQVRDPESNSLAAGFRTANVEVVP